MDRRPESKFKSSLLQSATIGEFNLDFKRSFSPIFTHSRYGTPELEGQTSWRIEKEAREMKVRLLTGEDSVLRPPIKAKKDMYPAKVKQFAGQHWEETTIPEPSVHRRMKRKERTLREGENAEETLPTRYQHLSANEQYSNFKEEYQHKVRQEMERKVQEDVLKLARRPESEDKARRSEKLHTLPNCFPGRKWYEQQKPAEVKPYIDHSTGLCKLCESSGLNYMTLVKALKRLCVCKTRECPNWTCVCLEDVEDERQCNCPCSCDSCVGCQVQQIVLRIKQ